MATRLRMLFLLVLALGTGAQAAAEGDWQTLATPHFFVHYTGANRDLAGYTGRVAEEVFGAYAPRLEPPWDKRVSVFIFPDRAYLIDNDVYQQGDIWYDSPGEVDLFKHRVLLVPDASPLVYRRNVHRLVLQAMIYRTLMGTGGGIMRLVKSAVYPEWLIWGLAESQAAPADGLRENSWAALVPEDLFPLTELYNFDYLGRTRARTALAQSAAMVRWIAAKWGPEKPWELIRAYPDYWSNDSLLVAQLGLTQAEFLAAFAREAVRPEAGPGLPVDARAEAVSGRFPGDAGHALIDPLTESVFYAAERDGTLNLYRLDGGRGRAVFPEVPFQAMTTILSPPELTDHGIRLDVARFNRAMEALVTLHADGRPGGIRYAPRATAAPAGPYRGYTEIHNAGNGRFAVCADSGGEFIAALRPGGPVCLFRAGGRISGMDYSPALGRLFFAAEQAAGDRMRIYSVRADGSDPVLEVDSPRGVLQPAVGRDRLYFSVVQPLRYDLYSIPLEARTGLPVTAAPPQAVEMPAPAPAPAFEAMSGANTLSADIVIPGFLWNASDEFGRNELWLSLGISTGIVSTSGFENDTTGAFMAPLVKGAVVHKWAPVDLKLSAEYQYGDVLDVQDYETRNRFDVNLLLERELNPRLSFAGGLGYTALDRRAGVGADYEPMTEIGPLATLTFDGVIKRDYLPRRGIGLEAGAGRILESWGATTTYTRLELDCDLFVPVSADTVFQIFGGVFANDGAGAPGFDMGRARGVMSQPLEENAGRYLAVGRAAYRFPLFSDLNWTMSGVILLRQVRMGIFADMGVVSDVPFPDWEEGAAFLTTRRSVGCFFLFDLYPVEGFPMPVVLTYAVDPEHDTSQVRLEFNLYF
ncbi:MAG: hypothetical protein ABIF71_12705 [Planctomycetota bacterium]